MAKYQVKNVQCDICGGVGPCGPGPSIVVAEVELQSDAGEKLFLSASELEGCCIITKSEETLFETLMSNDFDPEDLPEPIYESEGYQDFYGAPAQELFQEMRYLIYILRSDWDEIDRFKNETVGKYTSDFEIPKCDAEKAFDLGIDIDELEEVEEDEEGE